MSRALEQIAVLANRPMKARSLYLWHQILGGATLAGQHLREMAGVIVALPLGADIARQVVPIRPVPAGFDLHEGALPSADAVFAFVSEPGLRLVMESERLIGGRLLRRLRILDAGNAPFRRKGPERFMLRYRLGSGVLRAREAMVLTLAREAAGRPARLPPLHAWIEIVRGEHRQFVQTSETSAGMLAEHEAVRLQAFAPGDLAAAAAALDNSADGANADGTQGPDVFLYLELTGETVDVQLLGETLLV